MTSRLTQNGINGTHHHPQYYPHPTSSSSSKASFKGCCCCLFLLFSFLLLLILAVILVIVLAVKPKKPQFDLQQVGVQYVGITPNPATIATSSASVSLNIRMVFTAFNDNKVGIKYGESRFTIMYRGIPLGRGSVPAFYQPAHSVKRVETTIVVDRVNLLQADAADLIRDAALNDRVELRVLGDVGAKIRILGFTSPGIEARTREKLGDGKVSIEFSLPEDHTALIGRKPLLNEDSSVVAKGVQMLGVVFYVFLAP